MKKTANSMANIQEQAIEYAKIIANKIAKQYKVSEDDHKDLTQEAILCALERLPNFDPDKKCKLNTFIQKAVEGHLVNHLNKYGHAMHDSDGSTCLVNSLEDDFNDDDEKKPRWEEKIADNDEEEKREQQELIEHLRVFLKMLPDDERELIMVRFRFAEVRETVTHYIKRKKITKTVFYRTSDAIVVKLKRLMEL